jgi:methylphosphotriester-DNA--protein-cysteine methyltransferase
MNLRATLPVMFLLWTACSPGAAEVETLYITKNGHAYHKGSCGSLGKSKINITLEEAKAGKYRRCKRCHPAIKQ